MTPKEFKEWRKRMGWTQVQAAEELGLSKQHIIRLEKGLGSRGEKLDISKSICLATIALEKNLKAY